MAYLRAIPPHRPDARWNHKIRSARGVPIQRHGRTRRSCWGVAVKLEMEGEAPVGTFDEV